MILFFVFETKSRRIAGLALGLILGWVLGLYQIAKGAHFLSHNVVTMLVCFLIVLFSDCSDCFIAKTRQE